MRSTRSTRPLPVTEIWTPSFPMLFAFIIFSETKLFRTLVLIAQLSGEAFTIGTHLWHSLYESIVGSIMSRRWICCLSRRKCGCCLWFRYVNGQGCWRIDSLLDWSVIGLKRDGRGRLFSAKELILHFFDRIGGHYSWIAVNLRSYIYVTIDGRVTSLYVLPISDADDVTPLIFI